MPTACQRVTRSRSTTIASSTVAAGYSDISTPASDKHRRLQRQQRRDVGPGVQHRGQPAPAAAACRSVHAGCRLTAAITTTSTRRRDPGEHQRPQPGLDRRLVDQHEVQPERDTRADGQPGHLRGELVRL